MIDYMKIRELSTLLAENRQIEVPSKYLADNEKYICYVALKSLEYKPKLKQLHYDYLINLLTSNSYVKFNKKKEYFIAPLLLGIPYDVCRLSGGTANLDEIISMHLASREFLKICYAYMEPLMYGFRFKPIKDKYYKLRKELLTPSGHYKDSIHKIIEYPILENLYLALNLFDDEGDYDGNTEPFDNIVKLILNNRNIKYLQNPRFCDDFCLEILHLADTDFKELLDYNTLMAFYFSKEYAKNNLILTSELNKLEPTNTTYTNLKMLHRYKNIISKVLDYIDHPHLEQLIYAMNKGVNIEEFLAEGIPLDVISDLSYASAYTNLNKHAIKNIINYSKQINLLLTIRNNRELYYLLEEEYPISTVLIACAGKLSKERLVTLNINKYTPIIEPDDSLADMLEKILKARNINKRFFSVADMFMALRDSFSQNEPTEIITELHDYEDENNITTLKLNINKYKKSMGYRG